MDRDHAAGFRLQGWVLTQVVSLCLPTTWLPMHAHHSQIITQSALLQPSHTTHNLTQCPSLSGRQSPNRPNQPGSRPHRVPGPEADTASHHPQGPQHIQLVRANVFMHIPCMCGHTSAYIVCVYSMHARAQVLHVGVCLYSFCGPAVYGTRYTHAVLFNGSACKQGTLHTCMHSHTSNASQKSTKTRLHTSHITHTHTHRYGLPELFALQEGDPGTRVVDMPRK